jgi:hypothetical protein
MGLFESIMDPTSNGPLPNTLCPQMKLRCGAEMAVPSGYGPPCRDQRGLVAQNKLDFPCARPGSSLDGVTSTTV